MAINYGNPHELLRRLRQPMACDRGDCGYYGELARRAWDAGIVRSAGIIESCDGLPPFRADIDQDTPLVVTMTLSAGRPGRV